MIREEFCRSDLFYPVTTLTKQSPALAKRDKCHYYKMIGAAAGSALITGLVLHHLYKRKLHVQETRCTALAKKNTDTTKKLRLLLHNLSCQRIVIGNLQKRLKSDLTPHSRRTLIATVEALEKNIAELRNNNIDCKQVDTSPEERAIELLTKLQVIDETIKSLEERLLQII